VDKPNSYWKNQWLIWELSGEISQAYALGYSFGPYKREAHEEVYLKNNRWTQISEEEFLFLLLKIKLGNNNGN